MPFSEIWHCVDLVRTEVSEESITSFFRVERFDELGTTLTLTIKLNHIAK
jgi:hypothetical protein